MKISDFEKKFILEFNSLKFDKYDFRKLKKTIIYKRKKFEIEVIQQRNVAHFCGFDGVKHYLTKSKISCIPEIIVRIIGKPSSFFRTEYVKYGNLLPMMEYILEVYDECYSDGCSIKDFEPFEQIIIPGKDITFNIGDDPLPLDINTLGHIAYPKGNAIHYLKKSEY